MGGSDDSCVFSGWESFHVHLTWFLSCVRSYKLAEDLVHRLTPSTYGTCYGTLEPLVGLVILHR